jgi:hypothetical protein
LEKTNNNDGHWRTLKMMIGHLENTKLQFFELVGQFYTTAIPHFASIFHVVLFFNAQSSFLVFSNMPNHHL